MLHYAFDLYAVQFTEKTGNTWFCSTMYESYEDAERFAKHERNAWDFIDSFTIKPVWNWLIKL